jgi:hypothetical protein
MENQLTPIHAAIESGDKKAARRMLKPLLDTSPNAELWYVAACACENPDQEVGCLRQALKIDSKYAPARARYRELKAASEIEMPSLDMLVLVDDEMPTFELLTEFPELAARFRPRPAVNIQAIKAQQNRRRSRQWTILGCGGWILMSISLSYVVMTVLGSPLPAQVRQLFGGSTPIARDAGTPVFGQPNISVERNPKSANNPPGSSDIQLSDGPLPTPDGNSQTYADDAAAGGFQVQASKSAALMRGSPSTDVLDPGFAHEYTFTATAGEEIAIAIQFFSPTAKTVDKNVAILDGSDFNAENHCERDQIFTDNSGTAFICQIHESGLWKLQVFGRENESTGVYIVTYDRT